MPTPTEPALAVFDLAVVPEGTDAADALRATIERAVLADRLGYRRFWVGEHHLNPGIAGTTPHLLAAWIAAATTGIRVGSAATIVANSTPLQIAEQALMLDSLSGGRFDLGLGRARYANDRKRASTANEHVFVDLQDEFLPAPWRSYEEAVSQILTLLQGRADLDGVPTALAVPSARPEIWIHGSSSAETARFAASLGAAFGVNYRQNPESVQELLNAYREDFRPGSGNAPQTTLSVEAVVVGDAGEAAEIDAAHRRWLGARDREGLWPPYPQSGGGGATESANVGRRAESRIVGDSAEVVTALADLAARTGADELLISCNVHSQETKIRTYTRIAEAWGLAPRKPVGATGVDNQEEE